MTSDLKRDLEKLDTKETTLFDLIFRDSEGKIVIAQMPNLPIMVGAAALVLQLILPEGKLGAVLDLVAFGALFTWAWQELFEGVNYFRRTLGSIALVTLVVLKLSGV